MTPEAPGALRWADDRIWEWHSMWTDPSAATFFNHRLGRIDSALGNTVFNQHINGIGAETLVAKRTFTDLVDYLGYPIPSAIVYTISPQEATALTDMLGPDLAAHGVLAKPLDSSYGKGVYVFYDPEKFRSFLNSLSRPYIFQPYISMDEFRYGWYIDNYGIRWRFGFPKLKSSVTGDGESALFELILFAQNIPLIVKMINIYNHRHHLTEVPVKGKGMILSPAANWQRGGYMKPLPRTGALVDNLDLAVVELSEELEKAFNENVGGLKMRYKKPAEIGLRFVCYDLGLLALPRWQTKQLSTIPKEEVFPIEFQMPCEINYFFLSSPHNPYDILRAMKAFEAMIYNENNPAKNDKT